MSSAIKNTIAILCKLLNLVYKTNLKPEYFRLAKFNKSQENVIPILWEALLSILEEKCVISFKRRLHCFNYNRKQFYALTPEHTACSRELLLVLAFLISRTLEKDITEIINTHCTSQGFQQNNEHGLSAHDKFKWEKLSDEDLENYKNWLQGKILSNNKSMADYSEQIEKIRDKYNKMLDLKSHDSLTVNEILALKNKQFGEQFLSSTNVIVSLMTIYTEWTKKENIFWKWMATVLEEARNDE